MTAYSFLDVTAVLTGPGGVINLGSGAGIGEGGIAVEYTTAKNTVTMGLDGEGMHTLSAGNACTVTVTLLKTSPTNAMLQGMLNYQTASASRHGRNVIVIRDAARGDFISLSKVAFNSQPKIAYTKEGGTMEWKFDAIDSTTILGTGTPEAE